MNNFLGNSLFSVVNAALGEVWNVGGVGRGAPGDWLGLYDDLGAGQRAKLGRRRRLWQLCGLLQAAAGQPGDAACRLRAALPALQQIAK